MAKDFFELIMYLRALQTKTSTRIVHALLFGLYTIMTVLDEETFSQSFGNFWPQLTEWFVGKWQSYCRCGTYLSDISKEYTGDAETISLLASNIQAFERIRDAQSKRLLFA